MENFLNYFGIVGIPPKQFKLGQTWFLENVAIEPDEKKRQRECTGSQELPGGQFVFGKHQRSPKEDEHKGNDKYRDEDNLHVLPPLPTGDVSIYEQTPLQPYRNAVHELQRCIC